MCDTFVALPPATVDGSVIFAKNSDREANEAQQLEYHAARTYPEGSKVSCTYLTIPQAKQTHAVLLSRPFWMWGAEMGANEHGVVIGNEAVFTRLKVKKTGVLTGMDLLRLALERAGSAGEAKQLIIELLGTYGQGGAAGFTDKSFAYHNSFIIADKNEAWVLETAGEFWATKKITARYAISNGLTITNDFTEIHPEAEAEARKNGWVKGSFSFAAAFSDRLYTRFSNCKLRREQSDNYLNQGKVSVASAFAHLRSHHHEPYSPAGHWLSSSICSHAGNPLTRHASQTTGSLVAHLTARPTFWVTATAAPCLSTFKPVWIGPDPLPDLGPALTGKFNRHSYWWQFEQLHREVLKDYPARVGIVQPEMTKLELALLDLVYQEKESGQAVTREAFQRARQWQEKLLANITQYPPAGKPNILYRKYWHRLNKAAGIFGDYSSQ